MKGGEKQESWKGSERPGPGEPALLRQVRCSGGMGRHSGLEVPAVTMSVLRCPAPQQGGSMGKGGLGKNALKKSTPINSWGVGQVHPGAGTATGHS